LQPTGRTPHRPASAHRDVSDAGPCDAPDLFVGDLGPFGTHISLHPAYDERRRFGYRRRFVLPRREGEPSGRNRIHRLYREEGLAVRQRRARRKACGVGVPILLDERPNARWSLDFVYDQFANGRRFRVLDIADDVTQECLGAIPDTSISGRRVARELTLIVARRGRPGSIVSDNGTEFTCNAAGLVQGQRPRPALHCAGQADSERVRRERQRPHAR
jgi:hypothetical protein